MIWLKALLATLLVYAAATAAIGIYLKRHPEDRPQ